MKKGKSVKLSGYRYYKINYGTVDAKILKSIYLNIQTWVEPITEIETPQKTINYLSRAIKYTILDTINTNFFENHFIIDLDLRSSGINLGKKSFMNLECYFYLKNQGLDFGSKEIKASVKKITDSIIRENFRNNKKFKFSLTKKETV